MAFQETCRRQCQLNLARLETCWINLEVECSGSGRWGRRRELQAQSRFWNLWSTSSRVPFLYTSSLFFWELLI